MSVQRSVTYVLCGAAIVASLAGSALPASAGVDIGISLNAPGAPPPPRVERRPAAPFPDAAWIDGHWGWRDGRWAWVRGHWDVEHRGGRWTPGRWDRGPSGGYVWIDGHW
jgi:hypothetical protein